MSELEDYAKAYEVEWLQEQIYDLQSTINRLQSTLDQLTEKLERVTNVNRVEVIDNTGRKYVKYNVENVELDVQDDGKTLKVFVKYTPEEEISND